MYVTETALTIRPDAEERFLAFTRLYVTRVRQEPENLRCELMRDAWRSGSYVLHEAFKDKRALEEHLGKTYVGLYAAELASSTVEPAEVRHFDGVLREPSPPPLPRAARPAYEGAVHCPLPPAPGGFAAPHPLPRLRATLERLELSTATEGPLRGHPDPCLLIAAYGLAGNEALALGRGLLRLTMAEDAPCVLLPEHALFDVPVPGDRLPFRLLVLAVALEENAGRGVQRVYQALQGVESLLMWNSAALEPRPLSLAAFCRELGERRSERVQILVDDTVLAEVVHDDTWVGAAACTLAFRSFGDMATARLQFDTIPGKNDWAATLRVSLGL